MDPIAIGIGMAAISFGICTAFVRKKSPRSFGKLEPMKQKFGERTGTAIHVFGYTVVPIVFGVVYIIKGLFGEAVSQ